MTVMTQTTDTTDTTPAAPETEDAAPALPAGQGPRQQPGEIGGPAGPEPTRYGDWEIKGRCSDF